MYNIDKEHNLVHKKGLFTTDNEAKSKSGKSTKLNRHLLINIMPNIILSFCTFPCSQDAGREHKKNKNNICDKEDPPATIAELG